MTVEEARTILESAEWDKDADDDIFEGITILKKYAKGKWCYRFEHDQMWCGNEEDFDDIIIMMSKEDILRMGQLGWFEDEESWSCFS